MNILICLAKSWQFNLKGANIITSGTFWLWSINRHLLSHLPVALAVGAFCYLLCVKPLGAKWFHFTNKTVEAPGDKLFACDPAVRK